MPFRKSPFTGYPFDDEPSDRQRPFRSQLDDIAQRHPELAEHFQGFPFTPRSNTWGRKRRESEDDGRSQASSSSNESHRAFPSRFDSFFSGVPSSFHSRFADEDYDDDPRAFFHHSQHPAQQQYRNPQQQEQHQGEEQHNLEQQQQQPYTKEKPPRDDRSRKQNPNVPQSNTVDLGQKQAPLDENRGQRSMSAPPDNRSSQRFVSSIHIPVNQHVQGDMGGAHASKPATQQDPSRNKPNERVIPIHVEGRDEPVIPKNVNVNTSSGHHHPEGASDHYQQQKSRIFGQEPTSFTQFLNKGQRNSNPQQQHPQQQQQYQQHQYQQPQPPQEQQQQEEAAAAPPPKPQPTGPIEQIKLIQSDVLALMTRVEKFNGNRIDKEYLYLDEMLTRNLLKLDNIETEGKENIRTARREAIKCIQKCINILEAKANENTKKSEGSEQKTDGEMSEAAAAPSTTEFSSEAVPMKVAPDSSSQSEAATEASVSSSTDVVKQEPMEVASNVEVAPDSSASQPPVEADSQTSEATSSAAPSSQTDDGSKK